MSCASRVFQCNLHPKMYIFMEEQSCTPISKGAQHKEERESRVKLFTQPCTNQHMFVCAAHKRNKWAEKWGPIWDCLLVSYWPHMNCPLRFIYVIGPIRTQIKQSFWAHAHSSPIYLSMNAATNLHGANLEKGPFFQTIYISYWCHI